MPLFIASLGVAGLQMLALLLLVRILGTDQYATYSLLMAFGLTISALGGEWLRLIVARFSGLRARRLRESLLRTTLVWMLATSLFVACAASAIAGVLMALGRSGTAASVFVAAAVACASILGDGVQTFIRFNRPGRHFVQYAVLRVLVSSVAMLGAGAVARSGLVSALAFAMGVILVAGAAILRFWWPLPGAVVHRRLLRFASVGGAMALGSITTNATLTLLRLSIRPVMPAATAGAFFLSLDLVTRGLNALGTAFNTFSARGLYEASHARDPEALEAAAAKTNSLFSATWVSLALWGSATATAIPIILTGRGAYGSLGWVVLANLLAVTLLWARIFNLDMLMNAMRRYRAVAAASTITVVVASLGWLWPGFAFWALPTGVLISLTLLIVAGRDLHAMRIAAASLAAITVFGVLVLAWALDAAKAPTLAHALVGVALVAADIALVLLLGRVWLRAHPIRLGGLSARLRRAR